MTPGEQRELWNCLFLTLPEIEEFMAFVGLGLSTATVKFVAQFRKADRAKLEPFLNTVLTITVLSSLVVTVAFLISADALGLSLYSSPELAVMVRLSSLFLILLFCFIFLFLIL